MAGMSIHIPKISAINPWMMRLCTADMRDSHDWAKLRKNLPKMLASRKNRIQSLVNESSYDMIVLHLGKR